MKIFSNTEEVKEAIKAYVGASVAEELHVKNVGIPSGIFSVHVEDTTIKSDEFEDLSPIPPKELTPFEKEQLNKAGKS